MNQALLHLPDGTRWLKIDLPKINGVDVGASSIANGGTTNDRTCRGIVEVDRVSRGKLKETIFYGGKASNKVDLVVIRNMTATHIDKLRIE